MSSIPTASWLMFFRSKAKGYSGENTKLSCEKQMQISNSISCSRKSFLKLKTLNLLNSGYDILIMQLLYKSFRNRAIIPRINWNNLCTIMSIRNNCSDRPIFVGIPSAVGDLHDHDIARVRVVINLPKSTTEASLRSKFHTTAGPTKSIRMVVGDFETGEFGGSAVVEFTQAKDAEKLSGAKLDDGIIVRRPTAKEWVALGEGDWPGLSYGRIDPEIQKSNTFLRCSYLIAFISGLCSPSPESQKSSVRPSEGSWASVFAGQNSARWSQRV